MAKSYLSRTLATPTPQSAALPGRESEMAQNNAGGYAFTVGDWEQLKRFLILGSEGGTYYQSEVDITKRNLSSLSRCVAQDASKVVDLVVEISQAGRAPKNDPALMALAMAARLGNLEGRRAAFAALPRVARTFTHLSHFVQFCQTVKPGWSRGLRNAVAQWYTGKTTHDLVYQGIKYQARDGWSNHDLMILAHPVTHDPTAGIVFDWFVRGWESVGEDPHPHGDLAQLWAFEYLKNNPTEANALRLIPEYRLPFEAVPTDLRKSAKVWEALLEDMPIAAMVRNLATMTRVGLLTPLSEASKRVIDKLDDPERIRKSRLHPIAVLSALMTYKEGGQSVYSRSKAQPYTPVQVVIDALDTAFYSAFGNVEPIGKPGILACDISGSMDGGVIAGVPGLTPRIATACMAMVTARVEKQYVMMGFTSASGYGWRRSAASNIDDGITMLEISPRMRLDSIVSYMQGLPMGGTDCAQPILWAGAHQQDVDWVVIYTDNETWAGAVHPSEALQAYRKERGRDTRLAVVGMTSTGFSIADPKDPGMLDFVGFDAAAPNLMSAFFRGEL